MNNKDFPVQLSREELKMFPDVPRSIAWETIAPFDDQAKLNHCDQDLERLAQRGGLSPWELYCVMHRLRHRDAWDITERTAVEFLMELKKQSEPTK